MRNKLFFLLGFFFYFYIALGQGHACMGVSPFKDEIVDEAQVIFRGRALEYGFIYNKEGAYLAKIKFQVAKTYRGSEEINWEAIWENSTFTFPHDRLSFEEKYGSDIIVGLVYADKVDKSMRAFVSKFLDNENFESLPWVLEWGCSPPFMGSFNKMEPLLKRKGIIK